MILYVESLGLGGTGWDNDASGSFEESAKNGKKKKKQKNIWDGKL